MSAPRFSELQVIDTLILQGVLIPCYRCGEPITRDDIKKKNCQREHLHETGLGGPNKPENCRYSHRDRPCHATVTHGTKATRAGSSRHKISRADDLAESTALHRAVMTGTAKREPSRLRGRGFEKRKMRFRKPPGYKHNWGRWTKREEV